MDIPQMRVYQANQAPVNPKNAYVLYWMTAFRRVQWNYSLDRAIWWTRELNKPLVIFEALRCGYDWASDRLHQFIVEGMAANAADLKDSPAMYFPYLESKHGAGKGLLAALSKNACCVITDDFPAFFLPRMVKKAAGDLNVLLERIDSNGLLPMREAGRSFATAYAFRRFLQKNLPERLIEHPSPDPFSNQKIPRLNKLPDAISKQWPKASKKILNAGQNVFSTLPIDHSVVPVDIRGGADVAEERLRNFLDERLGRYSALRNHPDHNVTSMLSPYLHFGHISAHRIFHGLMEYENWFFDRLPSKSRGSRSGWWQMSESAEAFLDQLITWRELGFNGCFYEPGDDLYKILPDWAIRTLVKHEKDKRPYVYNADILESARTHDLLWNAAQTELVREGRIQNYLRMLWGKKILEWTETPREALDIMVHLNNKYALDGRDPNSRSGISWILGLYDRAWGPERPVFGKIRYMTSENAARKLHLKKYMSRFNT